MKRSRQCCVIFFEFKQKTISIGFMSQRIFHHHHHHSIIIDCSTLIVWLNFNLCIDQGGMKDDDDDYENIKCPCNYSCIIYYKDKFDLQ